jgi:hypothetical protein
MSTSSPEGPSPNRLEAPRRFVLALSTLIYAAVIIAGTILMLRTRHEIDPAPMSVTSFENRLGFTLMFTVVAALALITNTFAWLGTSRGERISAAVTSVAFGLLALFALWPFGLVVAPFPLLNAFFLSRHA